MPRNTLTDVFTDLAATRGEFLVYDDGFRSVSRSYEEVGRAARALAERLAAAGVRQGDRIIIWGENRPEWVAALWAAIISGIVVVPIDYRSSLDFVRRIRAIVEAKVILAGDDLPAEAGAGLHRAGGLDGAAVWRLAGIDWRADAPMPLVQVAAADTAEIIFTSGATAEPKGVVLTHRNILANTVPIEQEVHRVPQVREGVLPAALPQPAAAQPHVRPGDGHVHPADAAGHHRVRPQPQPPRHRPADSRAAHLGARVGAEDARRAPRPRAARRADGGRACRPGRALGEAVVAAPRCAPALRHEVLGLRRGCGAARPGPRDVPGRASASPSSRATG